MNFHFVSEMKGNAAQRTLSRVNIYQKARHKEVIICHSTLIPLSPPPDVWTNTNRVGANVGSAPREAHRGPVYIEPPAEFFGSSHSSTRCATVSRPVGSTGLRHGTSGPPCLPRPLLLPAPLQLQPSIPHQEGRDTSAGRR